MKKKLIAWLILVLVVLQAFFIPVFAEGEDVEYVEKSLSETNLGEDLLGDADSTGADLEDLIGGSFSSGAFYSEELDSFEVISAAYEKDLFTYSFYIYVMNRGAVNFQYPQFYNQHGRACSVTLKAPVLPDPYNPSSGPSYHPDIPEKAEFKTQSFSAQVVDVKGHFLKLRVDLRSTSDFLLKTSSKIIGIDVAEIGYSVFKSCPVYKGFSGGSYSSSLLLDFRTSNPLLRSSSSLHQVQSFKASEPVLSLDVTMMSERYSSAYENKWYQLNTAAFSIPNEYLDMYGDYIWVHYQYGLYKDVPMTVLESSSAVLTALSYDDFCPAFQYATSYPPYGGHSRYSFCPYFCYVVDSINHSSDGGMDVSFSEVLSSWSDLKTSVSPSQYQSVCGCSSYSFHDVWKAPTDSYSTTSFYDAHSWIAWVTAGNLPLHLYYVFFGLPEDDSLDDVPAIVKVDQITSEDPDDISSEFLVDPSYSSALIDAYNAATEDDASLILLRYCMTDYEVHPVDTLYYDGSYHPQTTGLFNSSMVEVGYVAKNSIISDFQILQIGLNSVPYQNDSFHIIQVSMDPVDFAEGTESQQHLWSGITKKPSNPFSWLKRILMIILAVFFVIVLFKAITLIVSIASLFKRRKDPSSDKQPKKRRRLFGRRRE